MLTKNYQYYGILLYLNFFIFSYVLNVLLLGSMKSNTNLVNKTSILDFTTIQIEEKKSENQ